MTCIIIGVTWRVNGYASRRPDDGALRTRLRDLARERRRCGYRRLGVLLAREGITSNHKKLLRIYRDECLNETLFTSLAQVREGRAEWRRDYNAVQPHSNIGGRPPHKPQNKVYQCMPR